VNKKQHPATNREKGYAQDEWYKRYEAGAMRESVGNGIGRGYERGSAAYAAGGIGD
jgi:hypothetical protein